ncbi:hypothetical protein E2C01_069438 [Portunus trituberculatus]|uniref:Uncharacterized protein n=1 Tax=Portunus trituberculatus TaxID=210409 RepID=A0A5B7I2T1_PORTR|nr:hypothetical protein [Portunus trituberculatus]
MSLWCERVGARCWVGQGVLTELRQRNTNHYSAIRSAVQRDDPQRHSLRPLPASQDTAAIHARSLV